MKRSHKASKLHRAPITVYGYHGCKVEIAMRILDGESFLLSENAWDWLGRGVYFWEYAPFRARDWAIVKAERVGGNSAVLEVRISLGECLNLLDTEQMDKLKIVSRATIIKAGQIESLQNTNFGAHLLDRAVIDNICDEFAVDGLVFQTVRGCFPEGEPLFPNSKILSRAHVQIAVRDPSCITSVRMVEFD